MPDTIPFMVSPDRESDTKSGIFGPGSGLIATEIPVDVLRNNMQALVSSLRLMLEHAWDVGQFELSEVELQVDVSASGELRIVGVGGGKLEGSGAMKLTFKKPAG